MYNISKLCYVKWTFRNPHFFLIKFNCFYFLAVSRYVLYFGRSAAVKIVAKRFILYCHPLECELRYSRQTVNWLKNVIAWESRYVAKNRVPYFIKSHNLGIHSKIFVSVSRLSDVIWCISSFNLTQDNNAPTMNILYYARFWCHWA